MMTAAASIVAMLSTAKIMDEDAKHFRLQRVVVVCPTSFTLEFVLMRGVCSLEFAIIDIALLFLFHTITRKRRCLEMPSTISACFLVMCSGA